MEDNIEADAEIEAEIDFDTLLGDDEFIVTDSTDFVQVQRSSQESALSETPLPKEESKDRYVIPKLKRPASESVPDKVKGEMTERSLYVNNIGPGVSTDLMKAIFPCSLKIGVAKASKDMSLALVETESADAAFNYLVVYDQITINGRDLVLSTSEYDWQGAHDKYYNKGQKTAPQKPPTKVLLPTEAEVVVVAPVAGPLEAEEHLPRGVGLRAEGWAGAAVCCLILLDEVKGCFHCQDLYHHRHNRHNRHRFCHSPLHHHPILLLESQVMETRANLVMAARRAEAQAVAQLQNRLSLLDRMQHVGTGLLRHNDHVRTCLRHLEKPHHLGYDMEATVVRDEPARSMQHRRGDGLLERPRR
nr:hypothetical protein BaRGS_027337 [Batillaria attramentaria]